MDKRRVGPVGAARPPGFSRVMGCFRLMCGLVCVCVCVNGLGSFLDSLVWVLFMHLDGHLGPLATALEPAQILIDL